jgi:hypothetical protein
VDFGVDLGRALLVDEVAGVREVADGEAADVAIDSLAEPNAEIRIAITPDQERGNVDRAAPTCGAIKGQAVAVVVDRGPRGTGLQERMTKDLDVLVPKASGLVACRR